MPGDYERFLDELPKGEKEKILKEHASKGEGVTEWKKPILCLDFDGVIHSYTSGWKGIDIIPDPPVEGAIEFLYEAICHFTVCIHSSRSATAEGRQAMFEWISKWELDWRGQRMNNNYAIPRTALLLSISFPTTKPSAFVSLDDRVITFDGHWPDMETLKNFKPWNKK